MVRVLIVDDDPELRRFLEAELGRRGFEASSCPSGAACLELLADGAPVNVVLSDLKMRGMGGVELCSKVAAIRADVPVVVMTAFGSIEAAVAAIRAGAFDFATKPLDLEGLTATLTRAVERRPREDARRPRRELGAGRDLLLGDSPALLRVVELIDRLAESDAAVLVMGESGTGKEVVARALHARSRRKDGPFVAVNCAAIPEALLESELFGHAKGAFTDAKTARTGLFVQASGGTLFLDEIAELPLALQPKLLRALQDKTVRPIGGAAEMPFDARIVAATNRDIEAAIEARRFREDLFFRIAVVSIELPPLRERGDDALLLAKHMLGELAAQEGKPIAGLSAEAAERLRAYPWPGNVRELKNCLERAVALARGPELGIDNLPERVTGQRSPEAAFTPADASHLASLEEIEHRYVLHVLDAVGGNKSLAARVLGLDRKTLYRKLSRPSPPRGVAGDGDDGTLVACAMPRAAGDYSGESVDPGRAIGASRPPRR